MKVSKTLLALSIAIAFEGAWAQDSVTYEEDLHISADTISVEGGSRYSGFDVNNGRYTINMANNSSLLITGISSSLKTPKRVYGLTVQKGSSLILAGNLNLDLSAKPDSSLDIRGIRVNAGQMDMQGDITFSIKAGTGYSSLIDCWGYEKEETGLNIQGNIRGTIESTSGSISGIKLGRENEAKPGKGYLNISSDVIDLNIKSQTGRVVGLENYDSQGHVSVEANQINITTNNVGSNSWNQGILSSQSTTDLKGNLKIVVKGGGSNVYYSQGINAESNRKDSVSTLVNISGPSTMMLVEGKTDSVVLRPSGANSHINLYSDKIELTASSANGDAKTIHSQYGGSLNIENKNAEIKLSASAKEGIAIGISNTNNHPANATDFQFGSVNILGNFLNIDAEGKNAYGILNVVADGIGIKYQDNKDGVVVQANTTINTISTAKDGESIGIKATNTKFGNVAPSAQTKVSTATVISIAQNGGSAYAVYLNDNGNLELGTSRLIAASDSGKAVGIFNNNGSVVKFTGDSIVQAETALQGNGTVNVETGAVLTLDGKIIKDEWTGIINANGKVAYGVAESIAVSDLANATDGTLLVIAGTEIAGNVNVGTVVTRDATATSHSLKVASDGTVLVRATDSYDGTSPLIKVDSVRAEKGSTVHLLNAAAVAEGTKVFESNDADEDSLEDYLFTTDNFLKKVENNRIVGEKSANVFGSDLLIPNVVDAAVNAANNEGADRILGLTNKALTQAQSLKAIHQFALMVPASGAQSTAINVANLQLDVIDAHASKLALHAEDKVGADLWIDLNGFLSKTNDYSAGSAKFGYKSDLAGVTIGSDYSFGNGYAAGVSVAFGKGSVRGQGEGSGVKNDVDYYGVNLYGVWSNDYFNTIGSVGYLQTKNEIKTQGFKGKPDAKTVSVGVRFEKPLALNEAITVTPHLGVRYKHVKLDSFNAGGFKYTTEKADIVEVPFGVAFNANLKAPCGADVKPFVDLTIAPNFGDRKVSNKIALAGTTASDSFDARIANNAMYNAKVGVNAVKGSHTFGLNYGIGGGNKGRVDQTLQARYTYRF